MVFRSIFFFSRLNFGRNFLGVFGKSCWITGTTTTSRLIQGGIFSITTPPSPPMVAIIWTWGGLGGFSNSIMGEPGGVCGRIPLLSPGKRVRTSLIGIDRIFSHSSSIFCRYSITKSLREEPIEVFSSICYTLRGCHFLAVREWMIGNFPSHLAIDRVNICTYLTW